MLAIMEGRDAFLHDRFIPRGAAKGGNKKTEGLYVLYGGMIRSHRAQKGLL